MGHYYLTVSVVGPIMANDMGHVVLAQHMHCKRWTLLCVPII